LINSHSALALDALRRWLAVLRWKTGIGSIGEPMVVLSDRSSGGAILEESATRYRFWQQGRFAVGRLFPAITAAQWQDAQTSLSKAEIPPVWFAFLFESHQRINNGDLVGASLSLAITLESIIRVLITQHLLTQKVEELILDIVDRAPIGSVLDRIRNLSFWDDQWERETDLKMFKEIMADRNRIMHSAQIGDLDEQDLRKRYLKMKSFAYFASQFLEAPPST
jgi:hypothetical protein